MNAVTTPRTAASLSTDRLALAAADRYAEAIAEGAVERDRDGRSPATELAELTATGLLAITVPKAIGGHALSYVTLADVVARIAAADASIAQTTQGHFYALQMVIEDGSPQQRSRLLGAALRGERFGNALSERRTAHAAEIRTRIRRTADGTYRLNGEKYYSTGSLDSDWIVVQAVDDDDRDVAIFLRRDADGVVVYDDWSAVGQRSTGSGTSTYTDVVVTDDDVVEHWRTFTRPTLFGAVGQIIHAAVDVGIAVGALEAATRFVREHSRPHFEAAQRGWERASDDPFVIQRVGQLSARVHAAEALLWRAGEAMDRARADGEPVAISRAAALVGEAKAFGGDTALESATEVLSLGGTRTADPRHGLDRYWRDARTHTLHDPNRWKYFHAGAYALNGTPPPNNGLH